jgi:nifR3 family TIM-barrel protein
MVGPVKVECPLVLAPMEDVSSLPFRLICKRIGGPGLLFTEFVSAMAAHYAPHRARKKMTLHPEERPLGIQIFGADVDTMVEAAHMAEEMGCDILDINMGCWVPKVCRTGAGAALLKDPDQAEKIVGAVARAVKVPVTVKVRAGWDYSQFAAPDLARRFQDAGAQMITLHARFAKQGFEGEADWALIKEMRKAVQVPLIGNGDVKEPSDAVKMMAETGCDGVMVGRAAISNPWAMARIRAVLMGQPIPDPPGLEVRIRTAIAHARLAVAFEAGTDSFEEARELPDFANLELRAVRSLRGQLPLYIKGAPGAAELRQSLQGVSSVAEIEAALGLALAVSA